MQRRDFRRDWEARHHRPALLNTTEEERRLLELDIRVEEDIEQLMRVVPELELPLEAMRRQNLNRFRNYHYHPRNNRYYMPEYYDGGLDEDDLLRIRQKKAEVNLWDDKKEMAIEQD
jgi:hypothetical protein